MAFATHRSEINKTLRRLFMYSNCHLKSATKFKSALVGVIGLLTCPGVSKTSQQEHVLSMVATKLYQTGSLISSPVLTHFSNVAIQKDVICPVGTWYDMKNVMCRY